MLKPLVMVLLLLAGLLAGFWLGSKFAIEEIHLLWPDLFAEMLRRSEDE